MLALRAGADLNDATRLAYWTWAPDATASENAMAYVLGDKSRIKGDLLKLLNPKKEKRRASKERMAQELEFMFTIQELNHGLTGEKASEERHLSKNRLGRVLNQSPKNWEEQKKRLKQFGLASHHFQDAFAHTRVANFVPTYIHNINHPTNTKTFDSMDIMYPNKIGHAIDSLDTMVNAKITDPELLMEAGLIADDPYYRPELFEEMAVAYGEQVWKFFNGDNTAGYEQFMQGIKSDVRKITLLGGPTAHVRDEKRENLIKEIILNEYGYSDVELPGEVEFNNLKEAERALDDYLVNPQDDEVIKSLYYILKKQP